NGEVFWRTHLMGKIDLQILTREEFVGDLRIHLPTIFVDVGGQNVAAQSFVASQCRGLSATAIVRSATGLAPLLDVGLKVVFRWDRTGRTDEVPVPLVASQLAGREAMISVSPLKRPKRVGEWSISWMVGDTTLACQRVRALSPKAFLDSLRIIDTRFVIETEKAGLQLVRQLPPLDELRKAGPCFVVGSREAGMAGMVHFQITAKVPDSHQSPTVLEQVVLVTDGPTVVTPSLIDVGELAQIDAFELRHKNRIIGSLPLSPIPRAVLTGEGGFKPTSDFLWNHHAEDELLERMSRLMNGEPGK
ncbi:MAG: hypothetical protein K8T89_23075, partial [Planctomycetes bacterium]|nr:hypothetical protein [Planctomycetota bacterium]